jgi:hypothetical protein
MVTGIESWIPAISALAGAVIGGGFTALATWYSFKKQWEKDIWIKKMEKLEQADRELFAPFLECAYRLEAKRDVGDIDCILGVLRKGRRFFVYCPKPLKQKLLNLYSALEREIIKKEGNWDNEDLDKLSKEFRQIEKSIYKALMEMKL